jgi:hypothetical protein
MKLFGLRATVHCGGGVPELVHVAEPAGGLFEPPMSSAIQRLPSSSF